MALGGKEGAAGAKPSALSSFGWLTSQKDDSAETKARGAGGTDSSGPHPPLVLLSANSLSSKDK